MSVEPITIVAVLGIASTLTMFAALVRQTMRAERAEAALSRVERSIDACAEIARTAVSEQGVGE